MSKKKRVRKDVQKYFQAGRYWELLHLLEAEDIVSQNAEVHQQAWKIVIKQALQGNAAFEQFRREVGTLKSRPNDPDFRFLLHLKRIFEGGGSIEDAMEIKGLSSEGVKLRSHLATFEFPSALRARIEKLLKKFMATPGEITRRYFEQLAGLLPVEGLQKTASEIGGCIPSARDLNHKAAVAQGWDGLNIYRLKRLDSALQRLTGSLPPALREVLCFPFVYNIGVASRRLAPQASLHRAEQLVGAIPFLLPTLAGEKFEEVKRKLAVGSGEGVEDNPEALRRTAPGLSLEEKVSLLGSLRNRIGDHKARMPDFLDEDEDEDDFVESDEEAVNQAQVLVILYRGLFDDISKRLPGMSQREKKELIRVMEPMLLRDLDFIFEVLESSPGCLSFLAAVLDSGCVGLRAGLLAVVAGGAFRDRDLSNRAENFLDGAESPTEADAVWLAREWSDFFYPSVRSLKPLLIRYGAEKKFLAIFALEIITRMDMDLFGTVLERESPMGLLFDAMKDVLGNTGASDFATARRELDALAEYEAMDAVRVFLQCHKSGRLSQEGRLCWYNAQYSLNGDWAWRMVLGDLERLERLRASGPFAFLLGLGGPLNGYSAITQAAVLFVQEHMDDSRTLSIDVLQPLMDQLLVQGGDGLASQNLLIRMEKHLATRVEAGEKAVQPLMEKIRRALQDLAKSEKKTPSKGRRRKR
ncbi:MAG: hypothetical protein AB7W37_12630 [Syntrophobacteraceae bacterium]